MSGGVPVARSGRGNPVADRGSRQIQLLTIKVAGQLVGVPITRVRDVLFLDKVTKVPLSPKEVLGVINLRGRIVTVVDAHSALGFPAHTRPERMMCVTAEAGGDLYGVAVDRADDLLSVNVSDIHPNPSTLPQPWRSLSHGIVTLDGNLLAVVDINRLIARANQSGSAVNLEDEALANLFEAA
jgi:purine-binding chemotaxis protein CheW